MNTLPAGLRNNNHEFFTELGTDAFCITDGSVIPFEEWSEDLLTRIENQMMKFPAKIFAINEMGIQDRSGVIKQYMICNYGGFDNLADMINGELQSPEHWPCPLRGICKFEGILCDCAKTDAGVSFTRRETQIIKLVAIGMLDKEIASHLGISLLTVNVHSKNIRTKGGFMRKADIVLYALKKQLI